ncbi:hydrolase [Massilia oculi]|uniref:Hydrolase n=2 Tax=Massilia oculi TaxID=945844 RepID=A0A2S2DQA0_9BURK|nr:hydrolase [Massilia oculi]
MAAAIGSAGAAQAAAQANDNAPAVRYDTVQVKGVDVFFREAGPKDAPAVLLLHGFGASSHMFRDLIPQLAGGYRVIAPDLPGFGLTRADKSFKYTFDNLADVIDAFTTARGLQRYAIYVFDYGAPVGWRLAVRHPEKITAIVSQNGNAYEEGLSPGWAPMRAAWADPTPANREALRKFNTLDMLKWQYVEGVKDTSTVAPDGYLLAHEAIERIGVDPQMDLLVDYGQNIKQYAQLHAYFRQHQPPLLAIWGKNDPFFLPPGAEAFKRDNPKAEVRFLDTGHFAIETHGAEIAQAMRAFLDRHLGAGK